MLLCCQIQHGEDQVEVVSRWKNKIRTRTRRRVLMTVEEGARQVPLRRSTAGEGEEGRDQVGGAGRGGSGGSGSSSMSGDEKGAKFEDNPIMTLALERACLKAIYVACSKVTSFNCFF